MISADYESRKSDRTEFSIPKNGGTGWRTPLITSEFGVIPSPQAYLIEQGPNSVSSPHFHVQNQFQLVVAGSATLGKHPVRPISVHYAQRETGYGPINAGEEGVSYLTLRPNMDKGSLHLPENRHLMHEGMLKRQVTADLNISTEAALCDRKEVAVEEAIPQQTDGLAAWLLRLPAGARFTAPNSVPGAGRFHVVAAGAMCLGADRFQRLGCVFTFPDEGPLQFVADESGLELMVLQFPVDPLPPKP